MECPIGLEIGPSRVRAPIGAKNRKNKKRSEINPQKSKKCTLKKDDSKLISWKNQMIM